MGVFNVDAALAEEILFAGSVENFRAVYGCWHFRSSLGFYDDKQILRLMVEKCGLQEKNGTIHP